MRFFPFVNGLGPVRLGLFLLVAGPLLIACGDDTSGPETDPNAELVLLAPKGGETFHIGDSLHVRWKAQGKGLDEINSVTVSLSPDSGKTWASLKNGSIATQDAQWGDFPWKIPATLTAKGIDFNLSGKTNVLVRVQDYVDVSDANKTVVVAKPITILP